MKPRRKLFEQELTGEIIGAAIEVHRELGPGLLESSYEICLARELELRRISFEFEKPLPLDDSIVVIVWICWCQVRSLWRLNP